MNRSVFLKTLIAVTLLGGLFSGGNVVFSQNPTKIVATFHGDPKYNMGFNWTTATSVTTGRVEIVQGHGKSHSDFTSPIVINATRSTHLSESVFKALATNLSPGTPYSYRVGDGANWSNIGTFTTAPNGKSEDRKSVV